MFLHQHVSRGPGRPTILLAAVAGVLLAAVALPGCGEEQPTKTSKAARNDRDRREEGENVEFVKQGVRHKADDPVFFQYIELNLQAKDIAKGRVCQSRLRGIAQQVQMYALQHNRLPNSLDELGLSGDAIRSPVWQAGEFAYIGGQDPNKHRGNILAYDRVIYPPGDTCYALRVGDSTPVRLRPKELDDAVGRTLRSLGRR
jgi:hypothetical protein